MPKYMIDDKEVSLPDLISHLSGLSEESAAFVPKKRLDAERAARKVAEEGLEAASASSGDLAKLQKKLAALEGENGELKSAAELSGLGITDARVQKALRTVYSADTGDSDKPPTLAEWAKTEAPKHPAFKGLFAGQADPAKAADPATTTTTSTNAGTSSTPAKPGARMTADQLAAHFRSDAYRAKVAAMPAAERVKYVQELQAQTEAGAQTTP